MNQNTRRTLYMFRDAAREMGREPRIGRTRNNMIGLEGRVAFEFGDLRVETEQCHIIVEHEGAGGVTNLAKYWHCLQKGKIEKPAHLFHLYHVANESDYLSHTELWGFLWNQMTPLAETKQFRAKLYRYSRQEELSYALEEFKALLLNVFLR